MSREQIQGESVSWSFTSLCCYHRYRNINNDADNDADNNNNNNNCNNNNNAQEHVEIGDFIDT